MAKAKAVPKTELAETVGSGMACRCGCGKEVERIIGECPTRFYASELCAYRGMMARQGGVKASPLLQSLVLVAEERKVARASRPKPTPPPRRVKSPEELEHSDLRYGPKRKVTKVLETYGTDGHRAKIEMECGHVRAWYAGEDVARCMKCRPTPISGGSGPRAKRVAKPKPTSSEEVEF